MSFIGIQVAANRTAIHQDFLSDGLEGLEHMSEDDVKDSCSSYAKRTDAPFPIILTPTQCLRFKALVLYVKDRSCAQLVPEFENGTTQPQFRQILNETLERDRAQQEQKKVGESKLNAAIDNQLKSQSQFEKFTEELETISSMIIGARGVPLSYVIREDEADQYDATKTYKEAILQAVPLTGNDYSVDARTVHSLILSNVPCDSDAYTYTIKPLLNRRDGRRDYLALKERYGSDAAQQTTINQAKATLKNLRYKNERNFSFEKFSSKLQKAYDELETYGRKVHNSDIVDALWARIQSPHLTTFVSSLKIDNTRNPGRDYKLILQDIATEVVDSKETDFSGTPRGINATYTRKGSCPTTGVHTPDRSIFIGSYPDNRWAAEAVKPFHQEIPTQRKAQDEGKKETRASKRSVNAVKRSKRKLKALKKQIAAAKIKFQVASTASTGANGGDDNDDDEGDEDTCDKASNSFGGKKLKKAKKE